MRYVGPRLSFKTLLSSPDSLDSKGLNFDDKNENFPCCRCDWLVDDRYLFLFSSKRQTTYTFRGGREGGGAAMVEC